MVIIQCMIRRSGRCVRASHGWSMSMSMSYHTTGGLCCMHDGDQQSLHKLSERLLHWQQSAGNLSPQKVASLLFDTLDGHNLQCLLSMESHHCQLLRQLFREASRSLAQRTVPQDWTPAELVACAHQAARVAEYCTEAYGLWPQTSVPLFQQQGEIAHDEQRICEVENRTLLAPPRTPLTGTEITQLRHDALQLATKAGCAVTRLNNSKRQFVIQAMPSFLHAIRVTQQITRTTIPLFGPQWAQFDESKMTERVQEIVRAWYTHNGAVRRQSMLLQFSWDNLLSQCFRIDKKHPQNLSVLATAPLDVQRSVAYNVLKSNSMSPELINFLYDTINEWPISAIAQLTEATCTKLCDLQQENTHSLMGFANHLIDKILQRNVDFMAELTRFEQVDLMWSMSVLDPYWSDGRRRHIVSHFDANCALMPISSFLHESVFNRGMQKGLLYMERLLETTLRLPSELCSYFDMRTSDIRLGIAEQLFSYDLHGPLSAFSQCSFFNLLTECCTEIPGMRQWLLKSLMSRPPLIFDLQIRYLSNFCWYLLVDGAGESEIHSTRLLSVIRLGFEVKGIDLYGYNTHPTHPNDLLRLATSLVLMDELAMTEHVFEVFSANYRPQRPTPLRLGEKAVNRGVWRIPGSSLECMDFHEILQLALAQAISLQSTDGKLSLDSVKRHSNVLFAIVETTNRRFTANKPESWKALSCIVANSEKTLYRSKGWWVNRDQDAQDIDDEVNDDHTKITFEMTPVKEMRAKVPRLQLDAVNYETDIQGLNEDSIRQELNIENKTHFLQLLCKLKSPFTA